MIEDKKEGIKVAVNQEEADWTNVKMASETKIRQMEMAIIIEKEVLKLANKHLDKFKK
jgi:hypothetical protein